MLELAAFVEIGKTVEDKLPADKVDQVPRLFKILNERVMIHQFRNPKAHAIFHLHFLTRREGSARIFDRAM